MIGEVYLQSRICRGPIRWGAEDSGNTEWDAGKFGLRNDTSVFSTPAIQAAIDACHQQGGGTVVVARVL